MSKFLLNLIPFIDVISSLLACDERGHFLDNKSWKQVKNMSRRVN